MWIRKFKWPVSPPDMKDYIGRYCKVNKEDNPEMPTDDLIIECEEILGSVIYAHRFQINCKGKSYLISMLDFFAQMNGEKIAPEDIKAFNETQFHVQEPKKLWKKKQSLWQ